jgi:integrase
VQKSQRLCGKDREHVKPSSKAVQRLAAEFMATINTQAPGQPAPADITIAGFWQQVYEPFITDNLKPSTVMGYKQVWNAEKDGLKKHFGNRTLREYRTPDGSIFLTALAKKYSQRTVSHIKNLASGIFAHAVNVGEVDSNPWHDCKVLGKSKPIEATEHYTLEEIENIITALVEHVDCQLIMALCFFLGLRKGEVQGLQWGDVDQEAGWLHIRRAITRRIVGTPKTLKSFRSLPLIQPVKGLFLLWRAKCKHDQVWVFQTERRTPIELKDTATRVIRPALAEAKLEWKGFQAGRRGLGTALRALTGNSTAGRDVLGHEDEGVTKEHYEGALPEVAMVGLKLLEAKSKGKK